VIRLKNKKIKKKRRELKDGEREKISREKKNKGQYK